MNIDKLPEEFPPSSIDLQRRGETHISAWKNKEEFLQVYKQIFNSPKADIASKESALQTLKVWKIRQNRHTPVSVLCTLAVLEVQIKDARSEQNGKSNATELKSLYSGAFTRFINHLTESYRQSGAGRKGTMANRVKEIGIEGFLVELRHLCAHTSMSISLDVFRRSAEYCMKWLKSCYWRREMTLIQSCEAQQVKGGTLDGKLDDNLQYLVLVYDVATKAIHKGVKIMSGAQQELTVSQFKLLQEHAVANKVDQLSTVVFDLVRYLAETMKLPKSSATVNSVCDALLNCKYMFEAPVSGNTQGLAHTHQLLIQTLVTKGYIQTYLEKLIAICEDDSKSPERRQGAKFWATEIALAFRLLKKFKKLLKTLPERMHQYNARENSRKMSKSVRAIYQNKLRVDLQNTIVIGMSVNCPWHLRFSRTYLIERALNVNQYTKELLPLILALAEPHMKLSHRETIEAAMEKYTMNCLAVAGGHEDDEVDVPASQERSNRTSTPKKPRPQDRNDGAGRIYTLADVLKLTEANGVVVEEEEDGQEDEPPSSKRAKKFGLWTELPQDDQDWGSCPLGKLVWD